MILNMRLHPFFQTNGGASGIKRASKGAVATGDVVRGVMQSQIDQLRGTRDHKDAHQLTWQDVKDDYARVGIPITDTEAQEIRKAVADFSGSAYGEMRKAWALNAMGRAHDLTSQQQALLKQYQMCDEYCKVAPTYKSTGVYSLHRGVGKGYDAKTQAYAAQIFALKPGDTWNHDGMPGSFSSDLSTAKSFAKGPGGIVFHVAAKNIKNAPSIKGISQCSWEDEILVGDYKWKVSGISDQRQKGDGYYHIGLVPDI